MTEAQWAELKVLWDSTPPAPPDDAEVYSWLPPLVRLAFLGCEEIEWYCIDFLPQETLNRIYVATLDAMPQGDDAAKQAAADMLRSIAVAEGWEDCLRYNEEEDD